MSLNKNLVDWIESSNNAEEMTEFLQGLSKPEERLFWDWFIKNVNQYTLNPSDFDFNEPKCVAGNCYNNAQVNAIKLGLEYCEGAYVTEMGSSLILHGFNMIDGKVVDLTVAMNSVEGLYHGEPLPEVYYGVMIPNNFIQTQLDETWAVKTSPLLVKYFKHVTGE